MVNVYAFSKAGKRWVHPSNLWAVNRLAGYYPEPFNDLETGCEYCKVRFFDAEAAYKEARKRERQNEAYHRSLREALERKLW